MYLLGTATSLHHFAPPKISVGCGPDCKKISGWERKDEAQENEM